MDNAASPAFRNAVAGYKKSDVNEYLLKLSREFDKAIAAKDDEIVIVKAELSLVTTELNELKGKQISDSELESANNVIAAQTEELEKLKDQVNSLTSELSSANSKLESLGALSEKAEQYETMVGRMGEIYMEATADADRLRTEARHAAEELKNRTELECSERRELLEKQLREFAEVRKSEIARLLGESQAEIDRILAIFGERSRALADESLTAELEGFKRG